MKAVLAYAVCKEQAVLGIGSQLLVHVGGPLSRVGVRVLVDPTGSIDVPCAEGIEKSPFLVPAVKLPGIRSHPVPAHPDVVLIPVIPIRI
jgi:hypothetical protein